MSDELNQGKTDEKILAKTDSGDVQYASNKTTVKSNSTKAVKKSYDMMNALLKI